MSSRYVFPDARSAEQKCAERDRARANRRRRGRSREQAAAVIEAYGFDRIRAEACRECKADYNQVGVERDASGEQEGLFLVEVRTREGQGRARHRLSTATVNDCRVYVNKLVRSALIDPRYDDEVEAAEVQLVAPVLLALFRGALAGVAD